MKKIIATYIFIIVISKLTIAQEKEEDTFANQINFGLNYNPIIFEAVSLNSFHIGYKRNFKTKYFFRTAINSSFDIFNYDSKGVSINLGLERNTFFLKNKFKFLYGIDILLLFSYNKEKYSEYNIYGFGIGPVIGVEYLIIKKLSFSTEISSLQGFEKRKYIHNYFPYKMPYEKYPGYSHRFLGLIINYHF